jgi:hypothetical protein
MSDKKKKTNKTITLTPEQRLIIENSLRVVQQGLAEELAKTQSKILPKIVDAHYQDAKVYSLLTNPEVLELVASSTGLSKELLLQYQFQLSVANQVEQAKQKSQVSSRGGLKGATERLRNSRARLAAEEFIRRESEAADKTERADLKEECANKHHVTVPAVRYHIRKLKA